VERRRVATIVTEGTNAFEFAVACEVFGLERPELGDPLYEHRLVVVSHPVRLTGGWRIDSDHDLGSLAWADTVIVPAGPTDRSPEPELLDGLRAASARGARLVSFCSGVFTLAATGLLDGRPAATHWLYVDELRRRHPTIRVDGDVLYVDDGDILTSAGTAAAIDLSLHILRKDHGARVANQVARRMVIPPHRDGGQAQFAVAPVPEAIDDDRLGPVLDWMLDHLDEQVTVPQLARLAAMSPRSFARHFRASTGTTPLRWLHHQRVTRAQELLEATDLPIDVVASRVGFGSATNLRDHFRRVTSTTPAAYRRRFRGRAAA
jgi:AraC family transcriptional regulator, transcriptional activator FtrA